MSVLLKRSSREMMFPAECQYRCCTEVYGKNVKHVRRTVKRRAKRMWKKEVRQNFDN